MLLQLLTVSPLTFLLVAITLVVSLSIHEFAHALAADKLGDSTAKSLGRLTLNPLAHLDPVGTLLILVAGFGWGRPVPFNYYNLKNPKRDAAIIAFAGPLSNFIMAGVMAAAVLVLGKASLLGLVFSYVAYINLALGVFNLIPVHPLDGFKVVTGLLPPRLSMQWIQFEQYGIFILLFLIVTGATQQIISPVITVLARILGV